MRLPSAFFAAVLLASASFFSFAFAYDAPPEPGVSVSRIAFGSCNTPLKPTPVWDSLLALDPHVWVWLGDTVYADDPRPEAPTAEGRARIVLDRLPWLYGRQNAIPSYAALRERARILGTWDDHDYGINDAGAEFVGKEEAQRHFMDFYGEPGDSPRRTRPGVYASYRFGPAGRTVRVILLDTRTFRSGLKSASQPRAQWIEGNPGMYAPTDDPAATVLGPDQWKWLESALRQPADVRLIVSSIQILPDDHGFEKWGNFPAERRRLLRLIKETGATGVVLLSGDRHTGELSRLDPQRETNGAEIDPGYPLYELTSSSLNRSYPTTFARALDGTQPRAVAYSHEHNRHRVGTPLVYDHFGVIAVDWEAKEGPVVSLSLHLDTGTEVLRQRVALAALKR
ncbi:MAG: alkaline phosphatase D family protein [Opitutaceae bacterium]|nr:alkaline phosphatase D family protein [Opitutaceae bacterium]